MSGRQMFTRTLWKNSWRDIKGTLGRFIAILLISLICGATFAGLRAVSPAMKHTAELYYQDSSLADFRLLSVVGFTEDDIAALREVPGVSAVMPGQMADVLVSNESGDVAMRIHTIPYDPSDHNNGYLNCLTVIEGRLPENSDECVIGKGTITADGMNIGDTLAISGGNKERTLERLNVRSLKIVGVVYSPLYISMEIGNTDIGSGMLSNYLYVTPDAFAGEIYTEVFLKTDDAAGLPAFSDGYQAAIDAIKPRLEAFGEERGAIWKQNSQRELDEQQADFESGKRDAEQELHSALQKIQEAESALLSAWQKIDQTKAELAQGQAEMDGKRSALEDAQKDLNGARALLNGEWAQFDGAKAQMDEGLAQYNQLRLAYSGMEAAYHNLVLASPADPGEAITAAKAALETMARISGLEPLSPYVAEMDSAVHMIAADPAGALTYATDVMGAALRQAKDQLDALKADLGDSKEQLDSWKAALDAAQAALDARFAQVAGGFAELDQAQAALDAGREALKDAERRAREGEAQLAGAKAAYQENLSEVNRRLEEAEGAIADGRSRLLELGNPAWFIYTRNDNPGYGGFSSDADRMGKVTAIFPIFFFIVAALVCLTTMTRMVEDQRTQIGALKALGFSRRQIAAKYMVYAAVATIFGTGAGISLGLYLFPQTIWKAYGILYRMGKLKFAVDPWLIVITLGGMLLITLIPTVLAVVGSLRAVPATLMRPKTPKPGKRVLFEHIPFLWDRFKFFDKITARNLLLNARRFLMTVLGVLGCTALLLAGFSLRDAVHGVPGKQFDEIYQFDAMATLHDPSGSGEDTALNRFLESRGIDQFCYVDQFAVDVKSDRVAEVPLSVSVYTFESWNQISAIINYHTRQGKEPIPCPETGSAIITEKLASWLEVSPGDTVTVTTQNTDGKNKTFQLIISGISENYVYHSLTISPETYRAALGTEPLFKNMDIKFPAGDFNREQFMVDLLQQENILGGVDVQEMRTRINDTLGSMNMIIWIIILTAMALCFVVLYNLTNINIVERVREIATLKVLGFYEKEVRRYIFRENRVLTWIGIACGLLGGIALAYYIIVTAEVDEIMFNRTISVWSYLYSVAVTLITASSVHLVMRSRLKKIDMIDSLKSAE